GRASAVPTQDGRLLPRRTAEPGRLDGAPVSLRTTPRVISSMRLHIKDRDSAHRPWQVRRFAWRCAIFSLCDEESAATCCVGAPPHKHSEEFRPVPPIACTIKRIGENRIREGGYRRNAGGRSGSVMHWGSDRRSNALARYSLAAALIRDLRSISCAHLQKVVGSFFYRSRRCNRSAIFAGMGSFGTSPYSFRTSFPTQILKARATRPSVSSAVIVH